MRLGKLLMVKRKGERRTKVCNERKGKKIEEKGKGNQKTG